MSCQLAPVHTYALFIPLFRPQPLLRRSVVISMWVALFCHVLRCMLQEEAAAAARAEEERRRHEAHLAELQRQLEEKKKQERK